MGNPFPGMNPWLEQPALWGDVHFRLISALARYLSPLISPRYYVTVGSQAYIATSFVYPPMVRYSDLAVVRTRYPDTSPTATAQTVAAPRVAEPTVVEVPVPDLVEEMYLEIRETTTSQVITVIEVLSPTNKRPGVGRQKYERKRLEILSTLTHLVEIDLLRAGFPMPVVSDILASDYRILIRRGEQGNQAVLYGFNVRDAIPVFHLPLQAGDSEPAVDLHELLDEVYIEANYDVRIDYQRSPEPPLSEQDTQWAREVLRTRGEYSRGSAG